MREVQGDLFAQKGDALCITTNGYVNDYRSNVMGAGVAKEAMKRWPGIQRVLGEKIIQKGNLVYLLTSQGDKGPLLFTLDGAYGPPWHLVSFPTKPQWASPTQLLPRYRSNSPDFKGRYPGWMAHSNPELIYCSALELVALADEHGWADVLLPPPGCGMGGLNWKEVKAQLAPVLDDRFTVVHLNQR